MESELSGIFRVKLVTKNIVRGSPGTQFIHMRINKVADLPSKKIETLVQVLSCEFCEISKTTFSYRTPTVAVSVDYVVF